MRSEPGDGDGLVTVGRVSGVYGIRGWVKVFSYTDPRENILSYPSWWLVSGEEKRRFRLLDGRSQGPTIVACLDAVSDRDRAYELTGRVIAVERSAMPELESGEYYWTDLIGLEIRDTTGSRVGHLERMLETGAHDVMIVRRDAGEEILIPFVPDETVRAVSLQDGYIAVDWEWD